MQDYILLLNSEQGTTSFEKKYCHSDFPCLQAWGKRRLSNETNKVILAQKVILAASEGD